MKNATFNPTQDGHFQGCSQIGRGVAKRPLSLKSVTHILEWWNLAQLHLTYRGPKKHKDRVTHHLSSADISIFHRKSLIFVIARNTDKDCILIHNFYFLTFFESLKVVLKNMVAILMISAKLVTLGLLKTNVFWNKDYCVIISVHYVNTKSCHVTQFIL